jgi:hypothetical protein
VQLDEQEGQDPKQTEAQAALASWVDTNYRSLTVARWAEEREWFQTGMFDQLKQWLENAGVDGKKLKPMDGKGKKWPMPVTNHFSKTRLQRMRTLWALLSQR